MKAFTQIPFFRILLPFVAGILLAINKGSFYIQLFYLFVLLIPLTVFNFYTPAKRFHKWTFMLCADLILFLFGSVLVYQKDITKSDTYYANLMLHDTSVTFIASINDLPVEKTKFIKTEFSMKEMRCGTSFKQITGTIMGYFRKEDNWGLRAGQTYLIKGKLVELSAPKNPYEFDYRTYLNHKQINHTIFLNKYSCTLLPLSDKINPIWKFGLNCKDFILSRLKNSSLDPNSYAICAALITGYDDEIDRSVMDAFSHSGTLHVLSVSGLHTGLIYLALNFFFNLFDPKKKHKLMRLVFITLSLWFFALITGFSAPVLRAVLMFNLLGFGKIYFRARFSHQLNILLVSAFILLMYNPFLITDVGFLLSYFALFGLLYFQPKLSALWKTDNKFLDSLWQSVTASFAATISTLPITLFYFKQFPLWFFICNVVVVPATFLILLMAVFVVLKLNFFAILINYSIRLLIAFINLFSAKGFGFIDNIHFTFIDVVFLSLLVILISLAFHYRAYRHVLQGLLLLITWQIFSIIDSYQTKNESLLTVYNVKKKRAVSVKNKTCFSLNETDIPTFNFNIKPHFNSFNYANLDTKPFNFVLTKNQSILFLDKAGFWPEIKYPSITTLVLSNNFKLLAKDLRLFKNLKVLVSDGSNNNYVAAKTEELSRNFGLSFYNTKQRGAYLQSLQ
ncbi:hypothetical protein CNR22_21190 [Sphingobacteriaceae bacterium]|nr:hypothetical protein CNR22_21190 [Sphingobacteriaceae bacterium]